MVLSGEPPFGQPGMKILGLLVVEVGNRRLGPRADFRGEYLLKVSSDSFEKSSIPSMHTCMNHMSLAMEKVKSL
jgi:hypothetical protein